MITLKIGEDLLTEITFPCRDYVLEEKLSSVGICNQTTAKANVLEVIEPKDLPLKLNQIHNLDEINYLAKRMESFTPNEKATFIESVKQENYDMPKDLINATFNLHRYALIQDVSDMAKVGRNYILSKQGAISENEAKKLDFAAIGKEILNNGNMKVTDKGLLIPISGSEFTEVYDGTTFPEYDYIGNGFLNAEINFNGKTEYVYLPDNDLSISKAVVRLGAPNIESCKCEITEYTTDISAIKNTLNRILEIEGLYAVNKTAYYIANDDVVLTKLHALIDYAESEDSGTVCALSKAINKFTFIEDIDDDEAVGRYFVENDSDYEVHSDLEKFIDYGEFGKWLRQNMDGKFVGDGYVSMNNGYTTLENVLEEFSTGEQEINMGGM